MRIWDELSSDYFAAWRTYGEFAEALESTQDQLGSLIAMLAPGGTVTPGDDNQGASVAKDQEVVARAFNEFVKGAWQTGRPKSTTKSMWS